MEHSSSSIHMTLREGEHFEKTMKNTSTAEQRVHRLVSHVKGSEASNHNHGDAVLEGVWKFRFTCPHAESVLSLEQMEFYEKNGFLVVKGVVPVQEMAPWEQRLLDIAEKKAADAPPTMVVMRDVSQAHFRKTKGLRYVTKLQDFQDDPVLKDFISHPNILHYVSAFTGPNIRAMHTMLIQKPPNVGESGRHPMHQDLLYFPFRPANRIVCAWTAMESINRDNGGLIVIPGSHVSPLFPHGYPDWEKVNKAYYGIQPQHLGNFKETDAIHLEMEPGDTVFFHPLLVHGSGWNKTQRYRKAISCHYASTDCAYINVSDTIQKDIKEEVEKMAMKKLGIQVEFTDIWKLKSRLVSGVEGSLV
eukprot:TRINITY_DN14116_c0_g1_i1.p1 TRINITY_DN14116_c0_g1~~TRINITY_DN14116_c0_g1_i1.p1  ORF type:complete len:360 (-),score=86.86 TRINITY_DN14116_c0_g1_i1:98-1177(-)